MGMVSTLKRRVATRLLARSTRNGIDLRKLRFLPDSITMPLQRNGLDPLPEMASVRAATPVVQLTQRFGKGIWLVSG